MAGNVPGIVPSAALIGSRVIYKPFAFPEKFVKSSDNLGTAINGAVGGIAATLGTAFDSLQPQHGMQKLSPIFGKIADAAQKSEAHAQKVDAVFWNPFSQGLEGIGRAMAGPGTAFYLGKAGVSQPTEDMIKGVLNMKLFSRPSADQIPSGGSGSDTSDPIPPTGSGKPDDGGAGAGGTGKPDGGGADAGGTGKSDGGAGAGSSGDSGAGGAGSGGAGGARSGGAGSSGSGGAGSSGAGGTSSSGSTGSGGSGAGGAGSGGADAGGAGAGTGGAGGAANGNGGIGAGAPNGNGGIGAGAPNGNGGIGAGVSIV